MIKKFSEDGMEGLEPKARAHLIKMALDPVMYANFERGVLERTPEAIHKFVEDNLTSLGISFTTYEEFFTTLIQLIMKDVLSGNIPDYVKESGVVQSFNKNAQAERREATYRIPPNYWSWKWVKSYIDNSERLGKGQTIDKRNIMDHDSMVSFSIFSELGCPFYLVGSSFLEELEDTEMRIDDLRIKEEAPLPAESCLMLLPFGSLSIMADGEAVGLKAIHITLVDGTNPGIWFGALYDKDGRAMMSSSRLPFLPDGSLNLNGESIIEAAGADPEDTVIQENVSNAVKIGNFVSKILAAMAAEPKIVEVAVTESVRKAKKGKPELRFMVPPVIGWRVKYVRSAPSGGPKGSHGSPVAHWRRRHIRRVPYGPTNVPLEDRPRKIVVVARTRVNSEYGSE